jgi:hypothetical protein
MPKINRFLVNFFANNLCREIGFTFPISFHVVLIIRLFSFPADVIQGNRKYYKFLKLTILKRVLRNFLYEAGCSNLQIPTLFINIDFLKQFTIVDALSHGPLSYYTALYFMGFQTQHFISFVLDKDQQ